MAPSATNGDTAAALDDIKVPAGIVLPPHEIRIIIEKTAGYVARNGMAFEDRIREKERQNHKFSFLSEDDGYTAFYKWRLQEIKAGRGTAIAAGRAAEVAEVEQKPKGPPKPLDFKFSARMPRINQKDLEVLRLTALFVAKSGRQFQTQLAQREAGTPQFQFLIPNHTFHNYFQHLVDQYSILLRAVGLDGEGGKLQQELLEGAQRNIDDKFHVLTRARQRADYAKFQEQEKIKREEEEQKAKVEFASIDWNDFVVVETIVFTDADEQTNLPAPTTLADLQYASLEDRQQASINMRIEEAMPTDEDTTHNARPAQASYPLPVHTGYAPQQAAPTAQSHGPAHGPQMSAAEEEEERRIRERTEAREQTQQAQAAAQAEAVGGAAPMKIRENYVPRAAQRATTRQGQNMAICPNCKGEFTVDELPRHMQSKFATSPPRFFRSVLIFVVELLDPRWREQKAKAEARYETTNLTSADVANNLKRLASQRSDVFDGVASQPVVDEDALRRKKMAVQGSDGQMIGQSVVPPEVVKPLNVDEQIARIHEKFSERK